MALPTTGPISLGQVRTELNKTGSVSLGSTDVETREIYISNPSEKIINLCKEFDVKISKQPIKNDIENTFYVDQEGNLFFDEIFKDDKDMILTNLKEKHFMWVHTPTLLNSVNKYFLEKLSC